MSSAQAIRPCDPVRPPAYLPRGVTMLFGRERLLSPAQLQNLDQHKYSCQSDSILDPYMQPWWNWLVGRCPRWLAPNLITLAGLAVNIATTLILVYYNPDAKGSVSACGAATEGAGVRGRPACVCGGGGDD